MTDRDNPPLKPCPPLKPFDDVSDDHFKHTMDTMTESAAGFAKMVSAPPPHADDEALLVGVTEAVRDMDDEGYNTAMDRVARRLADLRARAEAAEAALAECRAKIARITTEPYHTVHRDFIKPEYFTPGHALKTKEPRT